MAKLRAISGGKNKEKFFSLVYGLRLYPAGSIAQVNEGEILQQNGVESRAPLHIIEGTRDRARVLCLRGLHRRRDRLLARRLDQRHLRLADSLLRARTAWRSDVGGGAAHYT